LLVGAALLVLAGPAAAQSAGDAGAGSAGTSSAGSQDSGVPGGGLSGQDNGPPGVPPIANSVLPATGFDPNQPNLRDHLLNAFGQNTVPQGSSAQVGPAWQYSPAISVSEELTDNPDQFGGYNSGVGRRGDDAITLITPSILVVGTTERFRVNLDYQPTGMIYAVNPDYSQFRQQFYGSVQATGVPDLFYADARASVSQIPVYGGLNSVSTDLLPPSQRETQSNLSISPYLAHSFGGTGTGEAGIGYIYSGTDAPNYLNADNPELPLPLPYNYGSQWLATRRVFASFTTGQDYGRFQDEIQTDDNFYDGSGASRDAHRILLTDDVSYAINRFVSGLGEFGYENLSYPNSGYSFVGGVWSAGARITPNAQSSLTIEYRRIDGVTAPYVYGFYQITPRIRVFGEYSAGITTFQQDQQNQLLAGTNDTTGVAASALLAAPLVNNASLFGANQALTKTQRANLNLSYILGRDVITAAFNQQRSSLAGNLLGLPSSVLARLGISNEELAQFGLLTTQTSATTSGTVTWRHDLTPTMSSDLQAGYSRSSVAQGGNYDYAAVQFSAGINKTFTKTLSGRLSYTGNYATNNSGVQSSALNSDTITITLRKTF
jgi:uncharacterized protein (PEP-CTERM system associated)